MNPPVPADPSGDGSLDDHTGGGGGTVWPCLFSGAGAGNLVWLFTSLPAKTYRSWGCPLPGCDSLDLPDSGIWDLRR